MATVIENYPYCSTDRFFDRMTGRSYFSINGEKYYSITYIAPSEFSYPSQITEIREDGTYEAYVPTSIPKTKIFTYKIDSFPTFGVYQYPYSSLGYPSYGI